MISFSHSSPGVEINLQGERLSSISFLLEHTPIHSALSMPNKWTCKAPSWVNVEKPCRLSLRHTLHLSHGPWFLSVENSWVPSNNVFPLSQLMNIKICLFLLKKNHFSLGMMCELSCTTSKLVTWWSHSSEYINKARVTLVKIESQ